ncbi:hypothetical protein BDF20DRAFT_917001 [Mycotypha africana]|uniref:uncharacterized protein n=1 Tax=Mycotypha africana TaxID=64632 RepID=UPI002301D321|nr:uncharacterized protein BDF20DRAFT_917001 [Mycotypha africana]KAI8968487.1 hypothetical protein BDF20DRAFT_917001 [Mycotypha africana]
MNNIKHIKEKPSFWKKLGLGKVSHKKSEVDQTSVKSKKLSHAPSLQQLSSSSSPPAPTPISTYSTTFISRYEQQTPPMPAVPRKSSLKHAVTIKSTTTPPALPVMGQQQGKDDSDSENERLNARIITSEQPQVTPLTTLKPVARTKSSLSSTSAATTTTTTTTPPSTTTSTVTPSTTSSVSHDDNKKRNHKHKKQRQPLQPVDNLGPLKTTMAVMTHDKDTPTAGKEQEEEEEEQEGKIMASFVMIENDTTKTVPTTTTTTPTERKSHPEEEKHQEGRNKDNDGLWQIIAHLRKELENEKATVQALQKQKEAVAKDLDYFEMTVDELYAEKTQLTQQLEDEKAKSQGHLEELNIVLEKMKSNADNARDKSFALDQVNLELKKAQEENKDVHQQIKKKDKSLSELKKQLKKSQEHTERLKETNDSLNKELLEWKDQYGLLQKETEILKAQLEQQQQKQQLEQQQQEQQPATASEVQHLEIEPDQRQNFAIHGLDIPTTRTPKKSKLLQKNKKNASATPKDQNDALDNELDKLLKEKEKIPLSGGGHQSRRRKEELEEMLDQVDSQLSRVKQKLKRS